ncbi:ArsR/SmtB family transcription factor [Roseomonas sp. GCM10028921]
MDETLAQLRAAAEPTRLRLLALCARGALCVTDLCAALGQSQPRLSRHLKLLVEAGLLERLPEGSNVYFSLAPRADLARAILARLPEDDPLLAADRRLAARLGAERVRAASEAFREAGADWDEMRALGLPTASVGAALLDALPARIRRLLDIGAGTGQLLELVAERCDAAIGVDASRDMLALARGRLAERGLAPRCTVRQADMYRLPFPEAGFDAVTLQMVLHYAEDPAAALAEAARVLSPDGVLLVVDLGPHSRGELMERHAHRWPGFDDAQITGWLDDAGCALNPPVEIAGSPGTDLNVRLWSAHRATAAQPA